MKKTSFATLCSLFVALLLVKVNSLFFDEEVYDEGVSHILSSAITVNAIVGESVTFPCDVDDLGRYVLIWKTGKSKILFALPLKITRDERFQVVGDTSLRISGVLPKDSGDYKCQISTNPPTELTHILNVLSDPKIYPDPASGFVTVNERERIFISWEATGAPTPVMPWNKPGTDEVQVHSSENNTEITIPKATRNHAGTYESVTDNSLVFFPLSGINLTIHISPQMILPVERMHAGEGTTVNLTCIVRICCGEPLPSVTWMKGDEVLFSNEHYHLKRWGINTFCRFVI